MRNLTYFIVTLSLFLSTSLPQSASAETVQVCATYVSTGKSYKVSASVIKGSELNTRTRTLDYEVFSTYAIITWSEGQASVIKLNTITGGISALGTVGQDQKGRQWRLSTSTLLC